MEAGARTKAQQDEGFIACNSQRLFILGPAGLGPADRGECDCSASYFPGLWGERICHARMKSYYAINTGSVRMRALVGLSIRTPKAHLLALHIAKLKILIAVHIRRRSGCSRAIYR